MTTKGTEENTGSCFDLTIPVEISGAEGETDGHTIKLLAIDGNQSITTCDILVNEQGKGSATLKFSEKPTSLRILLGPTNATNDELLGIQTIERHLSPGALGNTNKVTITAIPISSYYWYWWLNWCRTFTIRGKVTCPDGTSVVPGAEVCAYDVNRFWWWCGTQQLACATTDIDGTFEMTFNWCCGWHPWWWWKTRTWQFKPELAERIVSGLGDKLDPGLLLKPGPKPDLSIFSELLQRVSDGPNDERRRAVSPIVDLLLARDPRDPRNDNFDPELTERLGGELRDLLGAVPRQVGPNIWPWGPWHPWLDCAPDVIFRATQNCDETQKVIISESCFDARPNISTLENVTLVAQDACCRDITPPPEGNCINITHACRKPVYRIGGNLGAQPTPRGYLSPGYVHAFGDRPFAGKIPIHGEFGNAALDADYYEFEWYDGTSWQPMPLGSIDGFARTYWLLNSSAVQTASFGVQTISGREVIESRRRFEDNNGGAPAWGNTKFWSNNKTLLGIWNTVPHFADGEYTLRIKSWEFDGTALINPLVLPQCATSDENRLVLRVDNRIEGAGSGHPIAVDHPCTVVHKCTTEPDTSIVLVEIVHADQTTTTVNACDSVHAQPGDTLRVVFFAHDPDGHLAYYGLHADWGVNNSHNLLGLATPTPKSTPPILPASDVGPSYKFVRPTIPVTAPPFWQGGGLCLEIPVEDAFPEPCCYTLRLDAFKRTIVDCTSYHHNRSQFSMHVYY